MTDQQSSAELHVEIRELDPRPTVMVRVVEPASRLGELFDELLPLVAERTADLGGQPAGPPFGRYHEFGPDRVDLEIGIPVRAPVANLPAAADAPLGELAAGELPGGRVALVVHRGSYDRLAATYERLRAWIADSGEQAGPAPWESYVDDPSEVDEADLRTEIAWPLG